MKKSETFTLKAARKDHEKPAGAILSWNDMTSVFSGVWQDKFTSSEYKEITADRPIRKDDYLCDLYYNGSWCYQPFGVFRPKFLEYMKGACLGGRLSLMATRADDRADFKKMSYSFPSDMLETSHEGYLVSIDEMRQTVMDYLEFLKRLDRLNENMVKGAQAFNKFLDKCVEVCPNYEDADIEVIRPAIKRDQIKNLGADPAPTRLQLPSGKFVMIDK